MIYVFICAKDNQYYYSVGWKSWKMLYYMLNSRFILDKISHHNNKNKPIQPTKNIFLVTKWPKVTIFLGIF
jgi:hypothetical protein